MSELCVNTLPASKVTLIRHECISAISLESVLSNWFSLAFSQWNGMLGHKTMLF